MPSATDPTAPDFTLDAWQSEQLAARRRDEDQRRRDAAWREEKATRRKLKDGSELGPRFVSVPVDDRSPGEPLFRLVRQD